MRPHKTRAPLAASVTFLLLAAQPLLFAQGGEKPDAPTKEAKIRELLDLTSGGDFGQQFLDSMRQQFDQMGMMPEIFIERFMAAAKPDTLLDKAVELWVEHLDDETLEAGLEFFRSPGGKKWAAAQAKILPEFTAISQEWGQELAMQVMSDPEVMKELMGGLDMGDMEGEFDEELELEFGDEPTDGRARIASNETAAIGTLRTLSTCQAQFQSAAIVDQDGDGTGEFGYMAELAGVSNYRTTAGGHSRQPTSPAFVTSLLGRTAQEGGGIATKSGYHFVVYLPTASGTAARETAEIPGGNAEDANGQEVSFVIYAWPEEIGTTGNRAFVVTQQGEVFAAPNRDAQDYSGTDNIPAVDAALHKELSDQPKNAKGILVTAEGAGDDHLWLPAGN